MKMNILKNLKNKYISFCMLFIIIAVAMISHCYLSPERDNIHDPGSDNYIEWHGKITVASEGDVGRYPSIAVSDNNIYLSYYDNETIALKFAKSTDEGYTWSASNIKTVASDAVLSPVIKADGQYIYIAYASMDRNLKFAMSNDYGNSWLTGNIITVDTTTGLFEWVSMAVDGDNIYISYYDDDSTTLKFAKSTDQGVTWPTKIEVDSTATNGRYSSIAVDGNNVYISYSATVGLRLAKSINGGATWPTFVTVNPAGGTYTSIAVADNVVCISSSGATYSLNLSKSTDYGVNWDNTTVDNTVGWTYYTSIDISEDYLYISYSDSTNGSIKVAGSKNLGATWPIIKQIDSWGNGAGYTSVTSNGTKVYLGYYNYSLKDLIFAKSTNCGETW